MGWMDHIKGMLNTNSRQDDDIEEENEEFEDDEEEMEEEQEQQAAAPVRHETNFQVHDMKDYKSGKTDAVSAGPTHESNTYYEKKDYGKSQGGINMMDNFGERSQILLFKPDSLAGIKSIADRVNQKKTVILNLEGREEAFIKTVIDFFSGVAYANHGKISPIADQTYIVTPDNIDMDCEGGANIGDSELGNLDILDALNHDSL